MEKYTEILSKVDGVFFLIKTLEEDHTPAEVALDTNTQLIWGQIGLTLRNRKRFSEAIEVYLSLYNMMLRWEISEKQWTHKAMPLVWISECYFELGYRFLAKRYMMLTMIDDAKRDLGQHGKILVNEGSYFRLRYKYNMGHEEIEDYFHKAFEIFNKNSELNIFPEYILQHLSHDWMTEKLTIEEQSIYIVNSHYIDCLQKGLGDKTGEKLEWLASYLMSCLPGCRTYKRVPQAGKATDYDIVGSFDGSITDFRAELGQYFICECKDWAEKVTFTTVAKLARILASTKMQFGILFTRQGITGAGKNQSAERELRKAFQDSNVKIIVLSNSDIESIKKGKNLVNMLRTKYEALRLDLPFK